VAGGAPLYLSSCEPFDGCPGFVNVNQWTIDTLDHLKGVPDNEAFVRGAESGKIYRVAGGAPVYITDCGPLGECRGFVNVNEWTIEARDHLRQSPADGTVLEGRPSATFWGLQAGQRHQLEPPRTSAVAVDDGALEAFEVGP
jgi:hypothetical protein